MISVYLDSQDYSVLSKEVISDELRILKKQLLDYSESGQVKFFFSALVVAEAAPVNENASEHAVRRGDFIREICGDNSLNYPILLIENEGISFVSGVWSRSQGVNAKGFWLPEVDFGETITLDELAREHWVAKASNSVSRKERRAAERIVGRGGDLWVDELKGQKHQILDNEISRMSSALLLNNKGKRILREYLLGRMPKKTFVQELQYFFSDVSWLMRRIKENPEESVYINSIIRGVSSAVIEKLNDHIETSKSVQNHLDDSDFKKIWNEKVFSLIEMIATNFSGKNLDFEIASKAEKVSNLLPGISVMCHSIYSPIWDNLSGASGKLPVESQVADAMHGLYAPYVDLFRADRHMAPHIQKHVEAKGTKVVSKLADLPHQIELRLAEKSSRTKVAISSPA